MFKAIKVERLTAEAFNRSEQNTQAAFDSLSSNAQIPVTFVNSSSLVSSYIVKQSDLYVVVNSNGGPIKIVLPAAPGPTQDVLIKNLKGREISVVQSNGKTFDGVSSLPVPVKGWARMLNTGTEWTQIG